MSATDATVKVTPKKVSHKKQATVTAKVVASTGTPTGKVVVHYGKATKTVNLGSGNTVKVKLPKLRKGTYKVWVEYKGKLQVQGRQLHEGDLAGSLTAR